jgi:hypothetical protein
MRSPRILDVIRATKEVASAHPDVTAWWYAPPRRLDVTASIPEGAVATPAIELVVESAPRGNVPDRARIARELAAALRLPRVSVRPYRGAKEERALFRLLSR